MANENGKTPAQAQPQIIPLPKIHELPSVFNPKPQDKSLGSMVVQAVQESEIMKFAAKAATFGSRSITARRPHLITADMKGGEKSGTSRRKIHNRNGPRHTDRGRFLRADIVQINNKPEPVPDGKQVRIMLLWWTALTGMRTPYGKKSGFSSSSPGITSAQTGTAPWGRGLFTMSSRRCRLLIIRIVSSKGNSRRSSV